MQYASVQTQYIHIITMKRPLHPHQFDDPPLSLTPGSEAAGRRVQPAQAHWEQGELFHCQLWIL